MKCQALRRCWGHSGRQETRGVAIPGASNLARRQTSKALCQWFSTRAICPLGAIWQHLEIFLVVIARLGVPRAMRRVGPGMWSHTPQCMGQPPTTQSDPIRNTSAEEEKRYSISQAFRPLRGAGFGGDVRTGAMRHCSWS